MSVTANSRSIVHKGDGLQHVAAPPDVCKTPSPAGPIPLPYVNVAASSDLAGAKTVKIENQPAGNESSKITKSTGNEPGSAGGIISSKIQGELKWTTCSPNVKIEGKGAVRFLDVTLQNANTANTCFATNGNTKYAYGDDGEDQCHLCGKNQDAHRVHASEEVWGLVRKLHAALTKKQKDTMELTAHPQHIAYRKQWETRLGRVEKANKETLKHARAKALRRKDALKGELEAHRSVPLDPFGVLVDRELEVRLEVADEELTRVRKELERLESEARAEFEKADKRIKELKEKRKDNDAWDVWRSGNGYMIGVMRCKCGKTFAAMSGRTLPGFVKTVEELDMLPIRQTKAVTADQMLDVQKRGGRVPGSPKLRKVRARWAKLNDEARSPNPPNRNAPGVCAAAKLLGCTNEVPPNIHHVPAALVEMWWAPAFLKTKNKNVQTNVVVQHRIARFDEKMSRTLGTLWELGFFESERIWEGATTEARTFGDGDIVPSCSTCQVILPSMLCEVQNDSC